MKILKSKWLKPVVTFGLMASLLLPTSSAFAIRQNTTEDPAPNTASREIEMAIAKGKELVGITDYWWGGGHGGSDTKQYNDAPPKLDCSSFVHWMYNKGAGMMLGEVGTTTSYKQYFSKNVIKGLKEEEFKRGDLVYLNGGTHIVLWLGGNAFIGMQGYGSPDKKGGVQMTTTKGYKIDGIVIRLDKSTEGVKPSTPEPLKDPNSVKVGEGTPPAGTGEKKEGGETTTAGGVKDPFNPWIKTEAKSNVKGVDSGDSVISRDMYVGIHDWSKKAQSGLVYLTYILSAVLLVYTSSMVIWYFVMLPRNGVKGTEWFEKMSGVNALYSRRASYDLLGRWVVSVCILGFFMSGAYVPVMGKIYQGILALMS
ncbi:NlpC/P60 family protein [Bacillus thuringiensis]|uniref:NlpC/P60 family protein n=1 Tax=Bacillus thuringiensis TaxID=1428 RepID=UPI000C0287F8|nr:NlpC/P60 family protein [Bacillus thuringiensis]PGT90058.1 hypothetical protein COD17_09925 [Bacillus thuringiensis]